MSQPSFTVQLPVTSQLRGKPLPRVNVLRHSPSPLITPLGTQEPPASTLLSSSGICPAAHHAG
ncbi:protein of unknown function [Streptomyces sp. KY75]|nr:protein of unknown function [Streptomyces sp. KY75]CAD5988226.1 protein of unknown function [Streptomyces sp. KY70]